MGLSCGVLGLVLGVSPSLSHAAASLAPSLPVVDVSEDLEVDGDWLLSGQTKLPSPRILINEAALPVDGSYTEYHTTGVCAPLVTARLQCSLLPTIYLTSL